MALVPQVVDAVSVPVIAAGGIGDGRGLAAALMLGAEGVQMGTRFVVAKESIVHPNYKEKLILAPLVRFRRRFIPTAIRRRVRCTWSSSAERLAIRLPST